MAQSGLAPTAAAKSPVGGKAGLRQVSTAGTPLAQLISRAILCKQTIILDSPHHLFNALAHIGVTVQQLHL